MIRSVSALLLCCVLASAADLPKELLPNGDMEKKGPDNTPLHWAGSWEQDAANRFLRLHGGPPRVSASRTIALHGQRALQLTWRFRHGELAAEGCVLAVDFLDGGGQVVLPGPAYPRFAGGSDGWAKGALRCFVPPGAEALRLTPTLTAQPAAGFLDLDAFSLTMINPADVPEEAKSTGIIAIDAGKAGTGAGKAQPPALRVDGRRVVAATGDEVWLQGIALPVAGADETLPIAIATAVEVWQAKVIRLRLDRARWTGPAEQTAAYRSLVDQAVLTASSRGAHVILDLHRAHAPTTADAAFWSEVATRFRNHPGVLFGLFSEPYGISWKVWQAGGAVEAASADERRASQAAGLGEEDGAFASCGLQALVDAVRTAGANNVLVVGGLDRAYDLSGLANGIALDDRGGSGIVWDLHLDPSRRDWQARVLEVARDRALILGAVGCARPRADDTTESPYTWAPDLLGCIQRHRLPWIASTFATDQLVQDVRTFTPTPHWGSFVRSALLGKGFGLVRLR